MGQALSLCLLRIMLPKEHPKGFTEEGAHEAGLLGNRGSGYLETVGVRTSWEGPCEWSIVNKGEAVRRQKRYKREMKPGVRKPGGPGSRVGSVLCG